jgi:type I restriction enzyme S subunit
MPKFATKTLGDLMSLQRGYSYAGADLGGSGALVGLNAIAEGGGFKRSGLKAFGGNAKPQHQVRAGDLVIATTDLTQDGRFLGSPAVIPGDMDCEMFVSHHVAKALPDTSEVDPTFLAYRLRARDYLQWVNSCATGTTVRSVSHEDILAFPVGVPSLDVQRSIGIFLSGVDDLIEANSQVVSVARQLAIATLQDSRPVTTIRLGDVADVRRGLSYKGSGLSDSGMPMVNMGSAANFGWLKRSGWKFYTGEYKPNHVARGGDLIITNAEQTWRNEILGWPLLVPSEVEACLFTGDMLLVDFSEDSEWMRLYLWAYLFTQDARDELEAQVQGSTVARLPVDAMSELRFPIGSEDDASLVAVADLLELVWHAELESELLASVRDELLPHLMTGAISVDAAAV